MAANNRKSAWWRLKQSGLLFFQFKKSRGKQSVATAVCSKRAWRTTVQASVSPSIPVSLVLTSQDGPCVSKHHICVSGRQEEEGIKAKGKRAEWLASKSCVANCHFLNGHPWLEGGRWLVGLLWGWGGGWVNQAAFTGCRVFLHWLVHLNSIKCCLWGCLSFLAYINANVPGIPQYVWYLLV